MEKIADVLARKYPQFNTVVPDCYVSDALYQMRCENVDYLIVLEEDKFQGVISDHEIAGRILFEDRPLNKILVQYIKHRAPCKLGDDGKWTNTQCDCWKDQILKG